MALFKRGNDFNRKASLNYPFNEVQLANGKRLDSYNEALGEIVSRKATDLNKIKFSTFENYLKEMKNKYAPGTPIKSTKYKAQLDGKVLAGKQILEIPASNKNLSNIDYFINFAKTNYNITIRFTPE